MTSMQVHEELPASELVQSLVHDIYVAPDLNILRGVAARARVEGLDRLIVEGEYVAALGRLGMPREPMPPPYDPMACLAGNNTPRIPDFNESRADWD